MISSAKGEAAFTDSGFQNWKKLWPKTKDSTNINRQIVTKKLQQDGAIYPQLCKETSVR